MQDKPAPTLQTEVKQQTLKAPDVEISRDMLEMLLLLVALFWE